jgi:hypothetical protein
MKMNKILLLCVAVLIAGGTASAQKIKVVSGKMSALKGVTELKLEYDYSGLGVGDFEVEDDYINKKVAEYNEKEAGTGDSWKVKWFEDRPNRYEPKFEELFSKHAESIKSGKDVDAEVTMNIHTTFIEPGFNVGVMRRPAFINLEVTFTKGEEELVVLSAFKAPGADAMGFDFDTGYRISEAYAKAGKSLARYILKNTK